MCLAENVNRGGKFRDGESIVFSPGSQAQRSARLNHASDRAKPAVTEDGLRDFSD
jgi:hypothetical protein